MSSKHDGEVALITGGASGLGKATAEWLSNLGIAVYAIDLPEPVLKAEQERADMRKPIKFRSADVTNDQEILLVLKEIRESHNRLDYVINCAGILHAELVYDFEKENFHDLDTFTKVIQVNLIGTFNVIRLAIPLMAKNPASEPDGQRGVVINVSSIARNDAPQGVTAYAASKAAIAGMTMPLAREFGPAGIRVVSIAPGLLYTPMVSHLKSVCDAYAAHAQFPKRLGHAEEFAQLVHSIIENPLINATTIRLDGGWRIHDGKEVLEQ